MATSTFPSFVSSTTADSADVTNAFNSIIGDIVPMDASGTFTGDTFDIGTSTAHWKNLFVNSITIASQTLSDFINKEAKFDAFCTEPVLGTTTTGTVTVMNASFVKTTTTKLLRIQTSGRWEASGVGGNLSVTISDNGGSEVRAWRFLGAATVGVARQVNVHMWQDWYNVSALSGTVTVLVTSSLAIAGSCHVMRNADNI